ncbi:hypothetical protein AJ78_00866 [Emergomyces pasteurianus Ep9510]|uniref:Uncharacterized protein n=1 Tax=Emergomyces pasteurianus Ep9510 TaxID=1447872 RepID=A0A1J9PSE5_9EURO|nr:hypothetical protein AJ78_00866 [Emergomyces pasteurianus Ep9510]
MEPTEPLEQYSNSNHIEEASKPIILTVLGLPGDASPSTGGGTREVLEITKILEDAGICCCLVGISALKYYGAGRVRHVGLGNMVPTHLVEKAAQIFKSEHSKIYQTYPPDRPQLDSLLHTFPRFKIIGVSLFFTIIPEEDVYLKCISSNIERSYTGLPYPRLSVFAQSLLDIDDEVALTDLIDGMDLSEEWGMENLNLDGMNDVSWVIERNEKTRASVPLTDTSYLLESFARPANKKETWMRIVRTKESRIGMELPKEVFATRFRPRNDEDPRSRQRNFV